MASPDTQGPEKARPTALLAVGIVMALAVVVVAFVVDSEIGIPVVILLAICVIAALAFGLLRRTNMASDSDPTDRGIPKTEPDDDRPLGDTEDAHDEITPRDLPLDHPGREAAEEVAGGRDGTTRGPLP